MQMVRYRPRTNDPVAMQTTKVNTEQQPLSFTLAVTFKRAPDGRHAFFKIDGQRFEREKTVKFHARSKYEIVLTLRPPQTLQAFSLDGASPVLEEKERNDKKAAYTGTWLTDHYQEMGKGERKQLRLFFQIQDHGSVFTTIQCKFYRNNDKQHGSWGDAFNSIEYEFLYNDETDSIDILKENFR